MRIKVPGNLNDMKVQEFEPLPAGQYTLKVSKLPEVRESKKGSQYVNWAFEVAEGEYQGRNVFHITSLKDAEVMQYRLGLYHLLEVLGAPFDGDEFEAGDTVGLKLLADVGQEFYDPNSNRTVKSPDEASDPDKVRINNRIEQIYPYQA